MACHLDTLLNDLNAEVVSEYGLVTVRIPQPASGEVRVVIEKLPAGGWDWVVWRAGSVRDGSWSGVSASYRDAVAAVRCIGVRLRLAPTADPVTITPLRRVA